MDRDYFQQILVTTQRMWEGQHAGMYLVSVYTGMSRNKRWTDDAGRPLDTMPQCMCVVDDFGDLVPVRGWH